MIFVQHYYGPWSWPQNMYDCKETFSEKCTLLVSLSHTTGVHSSNVLQNYHKHFTWSCPNPVLHNFIKSHIYLQKKKKNYLWDNMVTFFIFIVPCIVIFYGITNRCYNVQWSLFLCKSTLHVSDGTHAHHQEYNLNCINSHWYNS